MSAILNAVSCLVERTEPDPIAQLSDIAKQWCGMTLVDVTKTRTPDDAMVDLRTLKIDLSYQRPIDRDKVQAMIDDPVDEPLIVNQRPNGDLVLVDGQHRRLAALLRGIDELPARIHQLDGTDEQKLYLGCMNVAKAQARVPAGTPSSGSGKGRVHPGQWTKESNPATLAAAHAAATNLPERVTIAHRLSQLKKTHAVAGMLTPKEEAAERKKVADAKANLTENKKQTSKAALDRYAESTRETHETRIRRAHEGSRRSLIESEVAKLPVVKREVAAAQKAAEKETARRQAIADKAYRAAYGYQSSLVRAWAKKHQVELPEPGPSGYAYLHAYHEQAAEQAARTPAQREKLRELFGEAERVGNDRYRAESDSKTAGAGFQSRVQRDTQARSVARLTGDYDWDAGEFRRGEMDMAPITAKVLKAQETKIKAMVADSLARERIVRAQELRRELEAHTGSLATAQGKLERHSQAKGQGRQLAAEAKKQTVKFAKQDLGPAFIGDLRAHPGQPRAVFMDDSVLKHDVLYAEHTRQRKPVKLRVVTNIASAWPTSNMWTTAEEQAKIKQFTDRLKRDKLIENDEVQEQLQRLASKPVVMAGIKLRRPDVVRHVDKYAPFLAQHGKAVGVHKLFVDKALHQLQSVQPKEVQVWKRQATAQFNAFGDVPAEHEERLVERLLSAGAKVTDNEVELPGYRSWADRVMDGGKRFTLDLGGGKQVHYVPHTSAGSKTVAKYTHTITMGGYSAQKKAALLRRATDLDDTGGYLDGLKADTLRALAGMKKPVTLTAETEKAERPDLHRGPFHAAIKENQRRLPKDVRDAIYSGGTPRMIVEDAVTYSKMKGSGRAKEPHKAPLSERGVLRFENMAPAEAVKVAKRLGVAGGTAEHVPYDLIYHGGHRTGRVLPVHQAYATGERALQTHDDRMVVHGYTGPHGTDKQVLKGLETLHATGGIKSIAERRRMGLLEGGMSKKGDMGSGIDQYVFTKYGSTPSYGHHMFFALKPHVMERAEVAFSPTDYGAGEGRYEKYMAHAKKIGQGSFLDEPSHEARQKHVSEHTEAHLNEVLLKHEIPLDDIDTIYIRESAFAGAQKLITKWKKAGTMPQHVRLIAFSGNKPNLAPRARELASSMSA